MHEFRALIATHLPNRDDGGLVIDMAEVYRYVEYYDWSWYYSPWIRRSVMADDFAYAISDAGIRVANMNTPSTPVATVLFDGARTGGR